MKPLNLFPLTVAQDKIIIDEKERELLVNEIKGMQSDNHKGSYAWTGDRYGYEFLFENPLFENLSKKISDSIIKYLQLLEINTDQFHTHSQSNISFAYYLLKPKESGGIIFRSNELQNEIAKNIFTSSKLEKSLIKKANAYNSDKSVFDLEQDSIIIFPSKTPHATMPNKSGQVRISISGDITIMLKNSEGFEHLMPNFSNWTKFK